MNPPEPITTGETNLESLYALAMADPGLEPFVTALQAAQRELDARSRDLSMLMEVSDSIACTMEPGHLGQFLLESLAKYLPCTAAVIALHDESRPEPILVAHLGPETRAAELLAGPAKGLAQEREAAYTFGTRDSEPEVEGSGDGPGIVAPLRYEGAQIGFLLAEGISGEREPSEALPVVKIMVDMAAVALQNSRLYDRTRRSYVSTITALAAAIDAKDAYTRGHSERVAAFAVAVAEELELTATDLGNVENAALLHDIGKIGIPGEILRKPASLTQHEYAVVKMHPYIGVQIIKAVEALAPLLPIIYHHHERYDGDGYFGEVAGEDIPVGARILAVADSFEAMTSDRPYRDAMSIEEAIAELDRNSGTQFDPAAVAALKRVIARLTADEDT